MVPAHLIAIGKLRDPHLKAIEDDYLKRIVRPKLIIHELKDRSESKDLEAQEVLKKLSSLRLLQKSINLVPVLLCEHGKMMNSCQLTEHLTQLSSGGMKSLVFILGGAEGHGLSVQKEVPERLSLSPLTIPHKLARILFIEQFYRVQTIRDHHPYHNG